MPAARYWRIVGISTHGADLTLSALHLCDDTGVRLDVGATLTCSHTPVEGALSALQDTDSGTTARFAARDVCSSGFALTWDFGSAVDVHGPRIAGPTAAGFVRSLQMQWSSDGVVWGPASTLGDYSFPGANVPTAVQVVSVGVVLNPTYWATVPSLKANVTQGVGLSADGSKIAVAAAPDYVFYSPDSGASWLERTASGKRNWRGLAVDQTGQVLLTSQVNGFIYTSADAGVTWTARTSAGSRAWVAVAMSPDGTKMVACENVGPIYTSTDGGATWATRTGSGNRAWSSVAVSADGLRILACDFTTLVLSTDGGVSWSVVGPTKTWRAVAVSESGSFMVAVAGAGGGIHVSTNGGGAWSLCAGTEAQAWGSVAMSADGGRILAGATDGVLATSTDGGATWRKRQPAPQNWSHVAVAANGRKMVAAPSGQSPLFTREYRVAPFVEPPIVTTGLRGAQEFASGGTADFNVAVLPALRPWRDMVFAGGWRIAGTVKRKDDPVNVPLRRRVRLHREVDGLKLRETWSDALTGEYLFEDIADDTYTVIAYDHLHEYRAVIADNLTPEPMP